MTPIKVLHHLAKTRPDDVVVIYDEQSWTYGKLAADSERLACGMSKHGIKPGDRVVLHMLNRPEMIMSYYACFRIGATAAPLRTAYKPAELRPLLERLKPSLYIGDAELYEQICSIELPSLKADAHFTFDQTSRRAKLRSCANLMSDDVGQIRTIEPDEKIPAVLITTSGTSGTPRFVIQTAATLAATSERIRYLDFTDNETLLLPNALAHASGLYTFLGCMQFGGKTVLLRAFDPNVALDAIEHHRCTWFNAMPAMTAALLECQKDHPRDVGSFRTCVAGGDVSPERLQAEFPLSFEIPLRPIWAATEAAFSFTFGAPGGAASRSIRPDEARLVDGDGNAVPRGSVGELLVRGPNVSPGYWTDDAIVDPPQGGWFPTGDMMRQDDRGDYWFVSRKKDLIIREGTNISPVEVERALAAVDPAIKAAAVIGVPDEMLGQRIVGFVQLDRNKTIDPAEILAKLREQLADYKVPERIEIVDTIPCNSLSKVDRSALLAMIS